MGDCDKLCRDLKSKVKIVREEDKKLEGKMPIQG